MRLLNLTSAMSVADIGAGSGFFAIPFARAMQPVGRLHAVDLQPEMLEFLGAKLRASERLGTSNSLRATQLLPTSGTPAAISPSSAMSGTNWTIKPSCDWRWRLSCVRVAAWQSWIGEPMYRAHRDPLPTIAFAVTDTATVLQDAGWQVSRVPTSDGTTIR